MELAEVVAAVAEAVPGADAKPYEIASHRFGEAGLGVLVEADCLHDVLEFLATDERFGLDMFTDVNCVDRVQASGKLELVYFLRSLATGTRISVKTLLDATDPSVATATDLWKGANWGEREVYDMFGVRFEGHPDLRRILLYPEFEGHPLRKSYEFGYRQSLVPERDPVREPWPKRR